MPLLRKWPGMPGWPPSSALGLRLPQRFLFLLFLSGLLTLCFGALFLLPDSSRFKRLFLPRRGGVGGEPTLTHSPPSPPPPPPPGQDPEPRQRRPAAANAPPPPRRLRDPQGAPPGTGAAANSSKRDRPAPRQQPSLRQGPPPPPPGGKKQPPPPPQQQDAGAAAGGGGGGPPGLFRHGVPLLRADRAAVPLRLRGLPPQPPPPGAGQEEKRGRRRTRDPRPAAQDQGAIGKNVLCFVRKDVDRHMVNNAAIVQAMERGQCWCKQISFCSSRDGSLPPL
ncbi:hypothetical protein JRQ81_011871 [Phrynocephalus forsythii]|uniref:Uncharacterized protein n=1 Tax=Phrynocephalus forsythii TaxID=171643 RepID=A0A9Q0X6Z9_9SAUR|nr:hypothetical protein JRQ81_011871 [Phrynocephalus forsythii]